MNSDSIIEIGDYRIVFSTKKRREVWFTVNLMLRLAVSRKLSIRYQRVLSVIAYNKNTGTLDGACAVYRIRNLAGLCIGKKEVIELIAKKLRLWSIIVPTRIDIKAKEKREIITSYGKMNQYIFDILE